MLPWLSRDVVEEATLFWWSRRVGNWVRSFVEVILVQFLALRSDISPGGGA